MAEDSLLADTLRLALERHESSEVVAVADNVAAITAAVTEGGAEIVLADIDGPGQEQILEWVETLSEVAPGVAVIALTARTDLRVISTALARGAASCVSKTIAAEDLGPVIRQAARGKIFSLPPGRMPSLIPPPISDGFGLTRRELEILRLVSEGAANKEVGRRLWVTEQTVKFHLSNVYRKLNVSNRTEASRAAHALGLVDSITNGESILEA